EQVSGEEAKLLPSLHRWACENDAAEFFALQFSHGHSHGPISLSRTRRPDTDDNIMLADRLDVAPLSQTFRTDETLLRWHSNTLGEEGLGAQVLRLLQQVYSKTL